MFFSIGYPCASINSFVHKICVTASSTPMSSASVELRLFSFCFFVRTCIPPSPIVITAPVWLLKSGCTANDASTYHLMVLKFSQSDHQFVHRCSRVVRLQLHRFHYCPCFLFL